MDMIYDYELKETVLPNPPVLEAMSDEMNIYSRFMRHLRHVPTSRVEIRVLSSIQFTADMMGYTDAQIAKILVDMGLRAPRMAFPAEFLKFADQALMRHGWEIGGPTQALLELKAHWDSIGEDTFAVFRTLPDQALQRMGA